MNQVPLPFMIFQKIRYTVNEDVYILILYPNETLSKRQWIMYKVINVGVGLGVGWIEYMAGSFFFSKGKGIRIKSEELSRYNNDVNIYWQQNGWVDDPVM